MRKVNIPMAMAFVLFYLTLISVHLTGGLYARYSVRDTGADNARVAAFDVSGVLSDAITVISDENSSGDYMFTVNNNSEVAVCCSIGIQFTEQIDERITVSLKTGEETITGTLQSDKKTVLFDLADNMAPGSSQTHTLTFEVTSWDYFTVQATDPATEVFSKEMEFTVYIDAVQID